MEDVTYAPAEAEPDRTVVWLLINAHYGTRKLLVCGKIFAQCSGGGAKCVSQSWGV